MYTLAPADPLKQSPHSPNSYSVQLFAPSLVTGSFGSTSSPYHLVGGTQLRLRIMSTRHKKPGPGQSRTRISTTPQRPALPSSNKHKQPLGRDDSSPDSSKSPAAVNVGSSGVVMDGAGLVMCGTCTAPVGDEAIGCDRCDGWFHPQSMCMGLPAPLINDIVALDGKGILFVCLQC